VGTNDPPCPRVTAYAHEPRWLMEADYRMESLCERVAQVHREIEADLVAAEVLQAVESIAALELTSGRSQWVWRPCQRPGSGASPPAVAAASASEASTPPDVAAPTSAPAASQADAAAKPAARAAPAFVRECEPHPSLRKYKELHTRLAAKGGGTQPFWWQTKGVEATIGEQLASQHFCVLDGFMGGTACEQLAGELRGVHRAGLLHEQAVVGQGRMHSSSDRQREALRSDRIGWFTGTESCWRVLPAYLEMVDHLVGLVRESSTAPADVRGCMQRSRAMVACYPCTGARYAKHCDNACSAGDGHACNGRRLTAILYCNTSWQPADGGELLIYPPVALEADPAAVHAPAVGRVAPRGNRLLLFYADVRVPHEVLPSHADRYAVTLWYYDDGEVKRETRGR